MSNTLEAGQLVKGDALEVTKAINIEYCSDVELQVLLEHTFYGGKIPYPTALILQELRNRRVRDLVVATKRCIDALFIAINRNYLTLFERVKEDTMGIDDVTYAHKLLAAHARNARRNAEQLRRLTRFSIHPFSLPSETEETKKVQL